MKNLIKPSIVMSFILMLVGLVPNVPIQMAILGIISMAMWMVAGVVLLGSEDRDYLRQLELIRMEHKQAVELTDHTAKKYADLLTQVSKALSENRDLAGRLR